MKPGVVIAGAFLALGSVAWLLVENRALHAQLQERVSLQAAHHPATPTAAALAPARDGSGRLSSATGPAADTAPPPVDELWANPQWRAARYNEAFLEVEVRNARFFQRLKGWTPERIEALKRQLATQSLTLMQAATTFSSNGDRNLRDEINRVRADNEAQLQATLTADEYRDYEESARMESSRQTVSDLASTMRSRGVTLEASLEDAMLRAYANTLHEVATRAAAAPVSNLPPEQRATRKRQEMDVFNEALLRQLSSVLNEAQLKSFMEAHLEQQVGN